MVDGAARYEARVGRAAPDAVIPGIGREALGGSPYIKPAFQAREWAVARDGLVLKNRCFMNRSAIVIAICLTGIGVSAAQAQPTRRLLADANGDGKVTLAEYQTSRRDYVMRADRNRDGKVDQAEWTKAADLVRAQMKSEGVAGADKIGRAGLFTTIDTNKDGAVTPAEVDARAASEFAMLDANKDGFVTGAEAAKAERQIQTQ